MIILIPTTPITAKSIAPQATVALDAAGEPEEQNTTQQHGSKREDEK